MWRYEDHMILRSKDDIHIYIYYTYVMMGPRGRGLLWVGTWTLGTHALEDYIYVGLVKISSKISLLQLKFKRNSDEILTKFWQKNLWQILAAKRFCHKAPDEKSNECLTKFWRKTRKDNEGTNKRNILYRMPENIASGRSSWRSTITTHMASYGTVPAQTVTQLAFQWLLMAVSPRWNYEVFVEIYGARRPRNCCRNPPTN